MAAAATWPSRRRRDAGFDRHVALGYLVAALDVLAEHFGMQRAADGR